MRISAAYFHPSGFYARGDVANKGKVPYYNDAKAEFGELDSYTVADVRIGYRFKGYDNYAFCNNLTDEKYLTMYSSGSRSSLGNFGDPRTFGVGVRYSF